MGIAEALSRFEESIGRRFPEAMQSMRPGLDEEGMDRLRAAVAPYLVPDQIRALYRWHDGGDAGIFGGWRMRPLDDLLKWYRFTVDELGSPRTWLPVFHDQIVNVVTLDVPGLPPSDPSVWYGHTHDVGLYRLFDSIETMLHVISDTTDSGALVEQNGRFGLPSEGPWAGIESLDGRPWTSLRLKRCPAAFTYTQKPPPRGTQFDQQPDPNWPQAWLVPLGITEESLALRGRTHTIAELVAAAASDPTKGTIRGRVVTGSGSHASWNPIVDDGTGQLVVNCDRHVVPMAPSVGQDGEFDVLLDSAAIPEPIAAEDPLVAALANRWRPPIPRARGLAARLIPE